MANLLNAVLQTPSNKGAVSPESAPAGENAKQLGKLFENSLKSAVSGAESNPPNLQIPVQPEGMEEMQDEVALANGLVALPSSPQLPVIPKINSTNPETNSSESDAKSAIPAKTLMTAPVMDANSEQRSVSVAQNAVNEALKLMQPVNEEEMSALPLNLQALMGDQSIAMGDTSGLSSGAMLSDLSGFDLDDVSSVEMKKSGEKPLSSKFSTSDFLSLRGISQQNPKNATSAKAADSARDLQQNPSLNASLNPMLNRNPEVVEQVALKSTAASLGVKPLQQKKANDGKNLENGISSLANPILQQGQTGSLNMNTVEATVTPSATGKAPVLSTESLNQIASQVNLLGQARQDGEIKIRLRPDHLGELQMSIRTNGQNVTVQFKAQNEEAKRIIEDSISSLRDHLSIHQLSLSSVDVVSQPSNPSGLEQGQMQLDSGRNQNEFANGSDRGNSGDDSRQSSREYGIDSRSFVKPQSAFRPQTRTVDSSRLDLIA